MARSYTQTRTRLNDDESYTQTRTRLNDDEQVKQDRRPKVASLEEFKRKQLENSKLLLEAVQSHKIKTYDKIFDYEELEKETFSITRYRNASKVELKKKSNKDYTIKHSRGDRKQITDFSYRARNSLRDIVNKLDRAELNHNEILFITLTYDGDTEKNLKLTAEDYNKHIKAFMRVLINKYKDRDFFAISRFDLQKRLVGHQHVVAYNIDFIHFEEVKKLWNRIIKQDSHVDVQRARSYKAVDQYVSKTLAKVNTEMNETVEIKSKVESYICKETDAAVFQHLRQLHIGRHYATYNNAIMKKYINEEKTDLKKKEYVKTRRVNRKLAEANNRKKLNKIRSINKHICEQNKVSKKKKKLFSEKFLIKRFNIIKRNHQFHSKSMTESLTNNFFMSNSSLNRLLDFVTNSREIEWHSVKQQDETLEKAD